jgi:hypothetical protein
MKCMFNNRTKKLVVAARRIMNCVVLFVYAQ